MTFARAEAAEPEHAALDIAGERLILRADRSVYWPRTATLFVADTHFGKAGVFRRHGMGLPQGTTDADLARLGAAIAATEAARVVVLGDFVHAPPAADEKSAQSFHRNPCNCPRRASKNAISCSTSSIDRSPKPAS